MADAYPYRRQIITAIATGDDTSLAVAARLSAEHAAEDFPAFHNILNLLGYHNRLELLNETMQIAWPIVQEHRSYSNQAADAFAGRAADHLLYAYLETAPEPSASDADLQRRLEYYFPIEHDLLVTYLALLQGKVGRPWARSDFAELTMRNLSGLLLEFLGYAHRFQAVPFARAHLLKEQLPRYLLDRRSGYLHTKPDIADLWRSGRSQIPSVTEPVDEPLVPDPYTLTIFLQRLLQTVDPQTYMAAATLELLPVWLRFLASRELIGARAAAEAEEALDAVGPELDGYWDVESDPLLAEKVARWHRGA